MQIEIKIDETCQELKVLILSDKITDEVNELFKRLSNAVPQAIAGFKDDNIELLQPNTNIRIFTANQKVYVQTEQSKYSLRLRLYELEERLDKNTFVRISNSEIINYVAIWISQYIVWKNKIKKINDKVKEQN